MATPDLFGVSAHLRMDSVRQQHIGLAVYNLAGWWREFWDRLWLPLIQPALRDRVNAERVKRASVATDG